MRVSEDHGVGLGAVQATLGGFVDPSVWENVLKKKMLPLQLHDLRFAQGHARVVIAKHRGDGCDLLKLHEDAAAAHVACVQDVLHSCKYPGDLWIKVTVCV